jgi:hypothetical protein
MMETCRIFRKVGPNNMVSVQNKLYDKLCNCEEIVDHPTVLSITCMLTAGNIDTGSCYHFTKWILSKIRNLEIAYTLEAT